ncbi:hypothetical protein [Streptomyces sp. NPDC029674]|uniref:hypothetical protein n=1 Tax=Streptomyces sp. NPDC029674 TaxID=3365297 RepID=UPI00384FDD17
MTPIDRTTAATRQPSSALLRWTTVLTGLLSIVAVLILSLTHNPEAAATVGSIGTAVTAIGGVQIGLRNRQ